MDSLQYEDSSQFVGSLMRDSFAMDANQPNYPPFQPRGPKPSEEWASASSKLTDGGSKEVVSVFDADGDGPPASLYADGSKGDGGITFSKFVSPGDGGGFMSPSASIDAPFTLDDSPVHSTLHAPRGPRPSDNADLVPSSTITSASSSVRLPACIYFTLMNMLCSSESRRSSLLTVALPPGSRRHRAIRQANQPVCLARGRKTSNLIPEMRIVSGTRATCRPLRAGMRGSRARRCLNSRREGRRGPSV